MNSQSKVILTRLKRYGIVSNTWALSNGIRRLASRIKDLRDEGHEIVTLFKNKVGERDCKYRLVK